MAGPSSSCTRKTGSACAVARSSLALQSFLSSGRCFWKTLIMFLISVQVFLSSSVFTTSTSGSSNTNSTSVRTRSRRCQLQQTLLVAASSSIPASIPAEQGALETGNVESFPSSADWFERRESEYLATLHERTSGDVVDARPSDHDLQERSGVLVATGARPPTGVSESPVAIFRPPSSTATSADVDVVLGGVQNAMKTSKNTAADEGATTFGRFLSAVDQTEVLRGAVQQVQNATKTRTASSPDVQQEQAEPLHSPFTYPVRGLPYNDTIRNYEDEHDYFYKYHHVDHLHQRGPWAMDPTVVASGGAPFGTPGGAPRPPYGCTTMPSSPAASSSLRCGSYSYFGGGKEDHPRSLSSQGQDSDVVQPASVLTTPHSVQELQRSSQPSALQPPQHSSAQPSSQPSVLQPPPSAVQSSPVLVPLGPILQLPRGVVRGAGAPKMSESSGSRVALGGEVHQQSNQPRGRGAFLKTMLTGTGSMNDDDEDDDGSATVSPLSRRTSSASAAQESSVFNSTTRPARDHDEQREELHPKLQIICGARSHGVWAEDSEFSFASSEDGSSGSSSSSEADESRPLLSRHDEATLLPPSPETYSYHSGRARRGGQVLQSTGSDASHQEHIARQPSSHVVAGGEEMSINSLFEGVVDVDLEVVPYLLSSSFYTTCSIHLSWCL
ncbi:unnamed protein product [Amoebophrya sp. A25]|nr:unnamed protein product [Amoebophrya sp. A25]|eukprot:GSA25T00018349001.1